jgi:hypothetical protein
LESLAEIELKYGKGDKKRDFSAIYRLKRASTYYRRSSDYKRAIIALRKAIIIAELNRNPNEFNLNFIETSYEECSHLYESIELHHLAKICRKNSNFFSHEEKLIANKEQVIHCILFVCFLAIQLLIILETNGFANLFSRNYSYKY